MSDTQLQEYRARQVSVAAILDAVFGPLAQCAPDLWERRAYLMLVGMVYERLAGDEDEVSTADLVSLAKVLAEIRRAHSRYPLAADPASADNSDDDAPAGPAPGRLPDRLADLIRQVYGTNFHPPEADE